MVFLGFLGLVGILHVLLFPVVICTAFSRIFVASLVAFGPVPLRGLARTAKYWVFEHMDRTKVIPLPQGDVPWSGLIQVMSETAPGIFQCQLQDLGMQAFIEGPLEAGCSGCVYCARVLDLSPLRLDFSSATTFVPFCPPSSCSHLCIKEACAGMGGIGIGCKQLSAQIVASVDTCALACDHLRRNGREHVIQGSICQDSVIKTFHLAGTSASTLLTAGFPCQPFSPQGDRKAFADERSQVYWGILKAARFMNSSAMMLECVPRAGQHPIVIASLSEFAQLMGWKVYPVILSLNDFWPSQRVRWWCLLQPAHLPAPALDSWPAPLTRPVLQDHIMDWPIWPLAEEQSLSLTPYELDRYADLSLGDDLRVLDLQQPCPVVLHSYSTALRPCPCGCRAALSEHRLQSGGLRGFYIRSMLTNEYRFLHPLELSFLVTVPLTERFSQDPRAGNCLLGQLAAPMQALWVYAHYRKGVDESEDGLLPSWIDPVQTVLDFRTELQHQQHDYWLTPSATGIFQAKVYQQGSLQSILVAKPTLVQDYLRAEATSAGWGIRLRLLDGQRQVPGDAWLKPQGSRGPYELVAEVRSQRRECPTGVIAVLYEDGMERREALVDVGTCLFEVFREWDITPGLIFSSTAGPVLQLDDRL